MPVEIPQPSVNLKAFACPHCGAHSDQLWHDCYAAQIRTEQRTPTIAHSGADQRLESALELAKRERDQTKVESLTRVLEWARQSLVGEPFFESQTYSSGDLIVHNLNISHCYTCRKLSLWVHDRLIYPPALGGPAPHPDLPAPLAADFEEARRILNLSPRGAAALLRLLVQKLCKELGEKGKNIDDDIASLVRKGLDVGVQQALDAVRVIGNQAVHPGQMDLEDDHDTAGLLFELVNDITAQTISRKKRSDALYAKLPERAKQAINERNAKALKGTGDDEAVG